MKYKYILLFSLTLIGCSFYSFKGSIPGHINSVYISPIKNNTPESSASDLIKSELQRSFINENILKLLSVDNSDSRLDLTVMSFIDKPYLYNIDEISSTGYEVVDRYKIDIRVKAEWHDIKNDILLFEQEFSGWASYDPQKDIGSDGIDNDNDSFIDEKDDDEFGLPRESAIKIASRQITESIINNIISTW
jgi:hypothetical protein